MNNKCRQTIYSASFINLLFSCVIFCRFIEKKGIKNIKGWSRIRLSISKMFIFIILFLQVPITFMTWGNLNNEKNFKSLATKMSIRTSTNRILGNKVYCPESTSRPKRWLLYSVVITWGCRIASIGSACNPTAPHICNRIQESSFRPRKWNLTGWFYPVFRFPQM